MTHAHRARASPADATAAQGPSVRSSGAFSSSTVRRGTLSTHVAAVPGKSWRSSSSSAPPAGSAVERQKAHAAPPSPVKAQVSRHALHAPRAGATTWRRGFHVQAGQFAAIPVTRHGSMRRSGLRAQRNRFHPRGTAATEAHVSFRLSVCASLRWRLRRGHFDVIQRPRCARGRRAGDCARCPRPQARLRQATEQLGRSSPQPCTHQGNGEPWPRGRRGERRTPPAVRQLAAPRWEAAGRFRTWQWRRRQWLWSPVCRAMPARSVSNKAVRPRSAADGARQHTCAPCNPEPGVRVLSPCASTPRRSPSVCLCALGRVCV